MIKTSTAKTTVPKTSKDVIFREDLINTIFSSHKKIIYINAGAGYGKTTLLCQIASSEEKVTWLTLDGENDIFIFIDILGQAIQNKFSGYVFNADEYLPYEKDSNFISIISNSFIRSIEKLPINFMIILDDLHTITAENIRLFIASLIKYKPDNIKLCFSSREAPWKHFTPFLIRDLILEFNQNDLAFSKDETKTFLGIYDEYLYIITEGWPLAVKSFKLLLDNGNSIDNIHRYGTNAINSYMFYECTNHLTTETFEFLINTACFDELDPQMLSKILDNNNSKTILEDLAKGNFFTIKTGGGFRYHSLFKDYLLQFTEQSKVNKLHEKALFFYYESKQYTKAAQYAMQLDNKDMLEKIILINYSDYLNIGNFSELRLWFNALGNLNETSVLKSELLVAKGALLSYIGNFTEANACLNAALPLIENDNMYLYIKAIVHKARVLRNYTSFTESNELLNKLILYLKNSNFEVSCEIVYSIIIEELYNLCWNSEINKAYDLAYKYIEDCSKKGNVKVKLWYERYLSVIYFLSGKMKDAVYYYEKSLSIPDNERGYLDMHSINIYVAKAYQMLGDRNKAVNMITTELSKLKNTGRYEELWIGYLFAGEIHYQNTFIDIMNGENKSFETTIRYFSLAKEYAPLFRKTDFQIKCTKMQQDVYSLMFTDGSKDKIINEIYENLSNVSDYFKTITLARLFSYFGSVSDFNGAIKCAKLSIEIGERANMMLIPTMAYGILIRAALESENHSDALNYTKRFIKLCYENGIYEYFKMRKAYDQILYFAYENNIEIEITKNLMRFSGCKMKKAYIETFGGFYVFSYNDRNIKIKMRTKKERELLAFLLNSGSKGVTKDQIYNAIWSESDSENVKKLIGVNISHIKRDFASLGISNFIVKQGKDYILVREEVSVDIDYFENATNKFLQYNDVGSASKIVSLYKGEYLADFEAHWAVSKRIEYQDIYNKALAFITKYYTMT